MVLRQGHTIGNFLGILIVNGGHWIAIKKVEDGYIWLDSLYDAPNEARDKIIDFGSAEGDLDSQFKAMIKKAKDFNGGLYIRKEDVEKTKSKKDDALLKKQKKKNWRGSEMAQGHNRILAVYRGEAHDFFPEVRAYQPAEALGEVIAAEPEESPEEVVAAGPKSILKRKSVGAPLEPNTVLSVAVQKPKRRIAPPPPAPSTPPKTPDEVLKTKKKIRIQSVPNVRIISPREERKKQNLEEVEENEAEIESVPLSDDELDEIESVPLSDDELDEIEAVPLSDNNNKPKKSVVNLLDELENDEEEDEEDEEEEIKPKKSAVNLLDELEDDEDEDEDEEDEEDEEEEIKSKKSAVNLLDELEEDEDEEEEEIKPKKSALNLLDELEDDENEEEEEEEIKPKKSALNLLDELENNDE
jgi:hypothetical protein